VNQETVTAPGEPIVVTGRFRVLFPTTAHGAHTARHAAQQKRSEIRTGDDSGLRCPSSSRN
jgi:hypothetical protein